MAIIIAAKNVAFDMSRTTLGGLQNPVLSYIGDESIALIYADGTLLQVIGSGFGQSASGAISSGTITYIGESRNGENLYTLDNFSLPASTLIEWIMNRDYQAALTYLDSNSLGIIGSDQSDDLFSFGAADVIYGGGGDDRIRGGVGADFLDGDSGNDILYGQDGDDEIYGNDGDDLLFGGSGGDVLDGGGGFDAAHYSLSSASVTVDLELPFLNVGDASGDSLKSIELVGGSNHSDSLRGNNAANTLLGQYGDDFLDGRSGDDGLIGGEGNDFLIGGDGIDALYGGNGADIFYYRSMSESDYREIIGDFQSGIDILQLVRAGFDDQLNLGELDPNRFVIGEGPTQGFGQFIYNSANNIFWDADGIGTGQAVSLLTFAEHVPLAFTDIFIV